MFLFHAKRGNEAKTNVTLLTAAAPVLFTQGLQHYPAIQVEPLTLRKHVA